MAEQTRLTDAELEALREKITPGPWNRRQRYTELRDEIGPRGRVIATVWVRKQVGVYGDEQEIVSSEEGEANAGLVTAAPALLAEVIERRARDAAYAELIEAASRAAIAATKGDESSPGTIRNKDLDRLRAALANPEFLGACLDVARKGAA